VTGAMVLAVVSLPLPSVNGITNYGSLSLSGNSSKTIQPGIYTKISVSGNAKLTLSAGIYIIEGGGFTVSDNASVNGSGVMIFNAGSLYPNTGGTYGSITLGGTGQCSLSPATSGTYAGIVFFQPPNNTKTFTMTGNASGISGTIYAPAASLSDSSNGAVAASLIVDKLSISGNGSAGSPNAHASAVSVDGPVTTISGNGGISLTGNVAGKMRLGGAGADTKITSSGRSLLVGHMDVSAVPGHSGASSSGEDIVIAGSTISIDTMASSWNADINTGTVGGLNDNDELFYRATELRNGNIKKLTAQSGWAAVDGFFAEKAFKFTTINDLEHWDHLS
jgi:hypothetical protein